MDFVWCVYTFCEEERSSVYPDSVYLDVRRGRLSLVSTHTKDRIPVIVSSALGTIISGTEYVMESEYYHEMSKKLRDSIPDMERTQIEHIFNKLDVQLLRDGKPLPSDEYFMNVERYLQKKVEENYDKDSFVITMNDWVVQVFMKKVLPTKWDVEPL